MPLTSENRLFAKFGLIVLNKTRRVGLLKLYQKAKIVQGKIDPYAVSFMIGPRLNAPGRMDHANVSYYLLSEKREEQAERLAQKLEENNQERQRLLKKILEQAKNDIKKHNLHKNNLIMVGGKDWPSGIIGLVAGKLKDEYGRPVLALAIGDKQAKGSARSIDNFHITEMLSLCSDCLIQYGGHKRAAGFSLINENIATLKEKIIDIAERKLTKDDLRAKIGIDAKIDIKDISWRLFEDLEKFEPTGFGNPRPVFLAENVLVDNIRLVGKQANHLKMKLAGFDSIFFSGGEYGKNIREGDAVDIVFQIDADDFMAERKLQLKIIDMRKIAQ